MTSSTLKQARSLVAEMPTSQAKRLRGILTLPVRPSRHRALIIKNGLPLGALIVLQTFEELRRVA